MAPSIVFPGLTAGASLCRPTKRARVVLRRVADRDDEQQEHDRGPALGDAKGRDRAHRHADVDRRHQREAGERQGRRRGRTAGQRHRAAGDDGREEHEREDVHRVAGRRSAATAIAMHTLAAVAATNTGEAAPAA